MGRDTRGKELKKEIREKTGLKVNELSVTIDKYSMGESFHIDLKKFYPISKIKALSEKVEDIDRDQATGDILSGGNTFLFVAYRNLEIPEHAINSIIKTRNELNIAEDVPEHLVIELVATKLVGNLFFPEFNLQDIKEIIRNLDYEKYFKPLFRG